MMRLLLIGLNLINAVTFPVNPNGELYVGKYFNDIPDSVTNRYHIDTGIEISADLIDFGGPRLFVSYRDELEAASFKDQGVLFDPLMAHYYLILGVRFSVLGERLTLAPQIFHDCTHMIDRTPDSNKVVFNRLMLSAGTPGAYVNKNLDVIKEGQWFDRLNARLTYSYFPHDSAVGALNSTDMFHDLQLDLSYDHPIYKNIYATGRLFGYFTRFTTGWNVDSLEIDHFWEHKTYAQAGIGVLREKAALELYLRYYISANFRLHSPDKMPYLGMHLRFHS